MISIPQSEYEQHAADNDGLCVREALDTRIVSPADMRRAAGVPVLARLGDLAAAPGGSGQA